MLLSLINHAYRAEPHNEQSAKIANRRKVLESPELD